MPNIVRHPHLLSHWMNELIQFDDLVRNTHGTCLNAFECVCSDMEYFDQWVQVEKTFALKRLEDILASPDAWKVRFSDSIENDKIPKCAESFIHLLEAITDRYRLIKNPTVKEAFVESVEKKVLNLFLEKISVKTKEISRICLVLNSLLYCSNTLQIWQEEQFLQELKDGDDVFDDSMDSIRSLERRLMNTLLEESMTMFQGRMIYFCQGREEIGNTLTTLRSLLDKTEKHLDQQIFGIYWRAFASSLEKWIEGEMLSPSLVHGIKAVMTVFYPYTTNPQSLFKRLQDYIVLLTFKEVGNLSSFEAIIEYLSSPSYATEEKKSLITEIGIKTLSIQECSTTLRRRSIK